MKKTLIFLGTISLFLQVACSTEREPILPLPDQDVWNCVSLNNNAAFLNNHNLTLYISWSTGTLYSETNIPGNRVVFQDRQLYHFVMNADTMKLNVGTYCKTILLDFSEIDTLKITDLDRIIESGFGFSKYTFAKQD